MKNRNLAKRVKELRKRKGFSQEKLTELSGLSLRTVQRIENGETEPTGDTLKKLSIALNITPDELVDWTIIEDKGFLKALNLSALTFLFFPLLGILIPLILWVSKKDKLKNINKIGKDIINFEITWTLIFFLGLILNIMFLAKKMDSIETFSPATITSSMSFYLIFIATMYSFNFVIIIINTYLIQKEKNVKYYPKINFLNK